MDKRWTEGYGQEGTKDNDDEKNVPPAEWHWQTVHCKNGKWKRTPDYCRLCRTKYFSISRSVGGKIIKAFLEWVNFATIANHSIDCRGEKASPERVQTKIWKYCNSYTLGTMPEVWVSWQG